MKKSTFLLVANVSVASAFLIAGLTTAAQAKAEKPSTKSGGSVSVPMVSNITSSGATVTFTSTVQGYGGVDYGTTSSLGTSTPWINTLSESFSFTISSLKANTTYYFTAWIVDASGATHSSNAYTFKTLGAVASPSPSPSPSPKPSPSPSSSPSPTPSPSCAFYVSPSGSDSASGTSSLTPFLTLEKTQTAMQAKGTVACTAFLEGGTYKRTKILSLSNSKDANKSWVAFPSQVPVLDGALSVADAIDVNESGITIQGLTIQNFKQNGINASEANNLTFTGNTITNIQSPPWQDGNSGAAIQLYNDANTTLSGNVINGEYAFGIMVGPVSSSTVANDTITGNQVQNTCTETEDCGAIYVYAENTGLSPYTSSGDSVSNNTIINVGTISSSGEGIYLDNDMSNVSVVDNLVYGTGTYAFQIHGGENNIFVNNIFDISQMVSLGIYQDCVTSDNSGCMPTSPMTGNVFKDNIVYSSGKVPSSMWSYYNGSGKSIANPAVSSNLYYDTQGIMPNNGSITDSSPIDANPLFTNASSHNYTLQSGSPAFQLGFSASQ